MSIRIQGLEVAVSAIIPAAGSGRRMGGGTAKQFLPLRSEPVLVHTVKLFSESPLIDEIVIAAGDVDATRELVGAFPKVTHIVQGGAERQDSVWAGLQVVHSRPRVVCVHDAVRALLPQAVLHAILQGAERYQAQTAAVPVKDTIKVVGPDGFVSTTPDRSALWSVQTPQVFWAEVLLEAHRKARAEGFTGTDDAALVERLGVPVHVHPASYENLKLTTPEDFLLAEAILARRQQAGGEASC